MRRKPVHALTVEPWLPFLTKALERLVRFISDLCSPVCDVELKEFFSEYEILAVHWAETDIFAQTEPWFEHRYAFAELDEEEYPYALPFKDVTVQPDASAIRPLPRD